MPPKACGGGEKLILYKTIQNLCKMYSYNTFEYLYYFYFAQVLDDSVKTSFITLPRKGPNLTLYLCNCYLCVMVTSVFPLRLLGFYDFMLLFCYTSMPDPEMPYTPL